MMRFLSGNDFMTIEISIVNSPDLVDVAQITQTFPDEGGTLGRGSNNFWVLDDPNKYMSSVHAKITLLGEQYILTDLSTNGTFINGAAEPIGNGNQITLKEGDHFTISDYEFVASLSNNKLASDPFSSTTADDPFADFDTPFSNQNDFDAPSTISHDPFGSDFNQREPVGNLSSFDEPQTDPLALLNTPSTSNDPFASSLSNENSFAQQNNNNDAFTATTSTTIASDNVATDAINWPSANQDASLIPDDWDDEDLMSDFAPTAAAPNTASPFSTPVAEPAPAAPNPYTAQVQSAEPVSTATPNPFSAPAQSVAALQTVSLTPAHSVETSTSTIVEANHSAEDYQALQLKNQQLQQEISLLKQQLKQVSSSENSNTKHVISAETQSVVNAMGLSRWNLDDKKVAEINETVGHLMRETMQGMMRVLKFRKKIKEEFRINVTTIQSVENNPLKFSANVDDAMENMFIKENNAYKSPVDAVKEGFQGIAEHQVAVIAGMQAAFKGMIDRFDPTNLESRFEKYKSSSLLSLGQKGKRWNAYKQYHQGLVDDIDDSFQHLFGYDFVQAYEEQMQRLISERLIAQDNNKNNNESTT